MKNLNNWQEYEAKCFIAGCLIQIGGGFHPDTPMADYQGVSGRPTFTKKHAVANQLKLNKAHEILGDSIYGVCLRLATDFGIVEIEPKHSTTIIFGKGAANRYENYIGDGMDKPTALAAACEDGGEWETFTFDTSAEMKAFLMGLEKALGWLDVLQVD